MFRLYVVDGRFVLVAARRQTLERQEPRRARNAASRDDAHNGHDPE